MGGKFRGIHALRTVSKCASDSADVPDLEGQSAEPASGHAWGRENRAPGSPRTLCALMDSVARQGNAVTLDLAIQGVPADAELGRDVAHDPVVLLNDVQ